MTRPPAAPFVAARDEGAAHGFFGSRVWLRAGIAQTGSALGLIEQLVPAGLGSPYHVHRHEDEACYVLEGAIRFVCGDASWVVGPGGFAFLPRGVPHGFCTAGDRPSRSLLLVTPAGFEGFVAELNEAAPPAGPPDPDRCRRVAAAYGIEILGPLPGPP